MNQRQINHIKSLIYKTKKALRGMEAIIREWEEKDHE